MQFDVLIRNGTVVDGTGSPRHAADVGVRGDRIEAIGDLSPATAETEIDAAGCVVCPGFIDVHVHSEMALLGGADQYAPLQMGVTTQFAGPDGFSWAPLQGVGLSDQLDYYKTFYDQSKLAAYRELNIEELLSVWEGNLPSNLALQVPHAAVRIAAMGWAPRPATADELKRMLRIASEWHEAGARSFATGLEYEPMRHADLRELTAFAHLAKRYGGIYVAHQRGYGDRIRQGCDETFAIGRAADIPVHISHLTVDDIAAPLLDQAQSDGVNVSFDMYPYPAGCTSLLFTLPQAAQAGSVADVRNRLKSPGFRDSLRTHLEATLPTDRVVFASIGGPSTGWEGKTLSEVQNILGGKGLTNTVCDILLQTDFEALMIYHWPKERLKYLETTFRHERHMVGTDGVYVGAKPHPRGFGTYPLILGDFVREKEWLSLEKAIYKMTGYPAERFRLNGRGVLRQGNYADVVVFRQDIVASSATFLEPRSENRGIDWVLVNGGIVMKDGRPVGSKLYGRLVQ